MRRLGVTVTTTDESTHVDVYVQLSEESPGIWHEFDRAYVVGSDTIALCVRNAFHIAMSDALLPVQDQDVLDYLEASV
jgi:hypothetical protein